MNKLKQVSVRLVKERSLMSQTAIHTPKDDAIVIGEMLADMDREVLCVLNLQADGRPINFSIVSMGALNQSIVEPREVFKASILSNAASMIIIHNHPSGTLNPSESDTIVTDRMIQLCGMMGIPLLDHIIVGSEPGNYFSFKEKGILPVANITNETDYMKIEFDQTAVAEETEGAVRRRRGR